MHAIDWKTGIFFEVPAIVAGRVLWNRFKFGKDGIEASDDAVIVMQNLKSEFVEAVTAYEMPGTSLHPTGAEHAPESPPAASEASSQPSVSLVFRDTWTEELNLRRYYTKALEAEGDSVMLFARLRVDLERELRGMAMLAGIGDEQAARIIPLRRVIDYLADHGLITEGVKESLERFLSVANRALRGQPVAEDNETAEVARLGAGVLQTVRRFTLLPIWLRNALAVRAERKGQAVERLSFTGTSLGGLKVNNITLLIEIDAPTSTQENVVFILLRAPTFLRIAIDAADAFAWVVGDHFEGTGAAFDLAPWLRQRPTS